VLERLHLPAAACLAIEDSRNGLDAALAAGLPSIITANDYTRGQDFSGALAVLPDLCAVTLTSLRALLP
jgi:beta-phosphoglucomutase-like phosphatase (HAD superfamily)